MNATFWGLVALGLAAGCGSKLQKLGGETGFLEACGTDADCQSGLCACGVCSRTCEETSECGRGACVSQSTAAACNGETGTVCLPKETSSDGPSVEPSSSAAPCRGQGHYQAGKEGSYLPCCEGLTEVFQLSPTEGDEGRVCTELPLRVYACVEGSCGDGLCEEGENVPCGCLDDCPAAEWERPRSDDTGDSWLIPDCVGFACEGALQPTSPGQVTIEVDVAGRFCGLGCGAHTPTLYEISSGLGVRLNNITPCDRCDGPPTGECEAPVISRRTWRGEIGLADSTCEWTPGSHTYCQSAPLFVPAGRYRAEVCTYPSYADEATGEFKCVSGAEPLALEPVCESVEFDFPSLEPVVIHLNNLPSGFDAGAAPTTADGGS